MIIHTAWCSRQDSKLLLQGIMKEKPTKRILRNKWVAPEDNDDRPGPSGIKIMRCTIKQQRPLGMYAEYAANIKKADNEVADLIVK